jgi:hypothetical protein
VLDAFFKPYELHHGRFTLSYFRFFGAAMTVLAIAGSFMNIAMVVLYYASGRH